jgi:hypothetical protein
LSIEDRDGRVIGEIATTYGEALSPSKARDFLSISWGFNSEFAPVDHSYVPRWRLDGERSKGKTESNPEDAKKAVKEALEALHAATGGKQYEVTGVARLVQALADPYVPGRCLSGTSHITG